VPAIYDYCHHVGCSTPLYESTPGMLCAEHQAAAEAGRARRELVGTVQVCECGRRYIVTRLTHSHCGRGACRMRAHRRRKATAQGNRKLAARR
jgi:hypothetical protein